MFFEEGGFFEEGIFFEEGEIFEGDSEGFSKKGGYSKKRGSSKKETSSKKRGSSFFWSEDRRPLPRSIFGSGNQRIPHFIALLVQFIKFITPELLHDSC